MVENITPPQAPAAPIDVSGIFEKKAGTKPTSEQIATLNQQISSLTNPAEQVSAIERAAIEAAKVAPPPTEKPKVEEPTLSGTGIKDVFGKEVPLDAATDSAKSNLFAKIKNANPNVTDEIISAEVNKILEGSSSNQIGQFAQNKFDDASFIISETAEDKALAPFEAQLKSNSDAIDRELEATLGILTSMGTTLDARLQSTIGDIQATFNRRREETKTLNQNILGTQTIIGVRSGRQRFAPGIQASILTAEENAGIARLTELDRLEKSLINQAISAKEDKDFLLLDKRMTALSAARKEKNQAILDLQNLAIKEEQLQLARNADTRADISLDLEIQEFASQQEDRIAESLASGFVNLDEEFNVIEPTFEEIESVANSIGIDPNILLGEVNKRIDEVRTTARAERSVKLNELQFEEQQSQNEINNEFNEKRLGFEQQRIDISRSQVGISAGNLSLAKAKFALEQAQKTIEGLPEESKVREAILELSAGQQEGAFSAMASFKNAQDILALLDKGVETGPIAGALLTGIKGPFGIPLTPSRQGFNLPFVGRSTKEENELVAAMTAFSANFIKSISGVAVSAQEFDRLMKALPSANRQEDVNRDSLKALLDTIENKYETQLGISLDVFRNPQAIVPADEADDIDSFLNSI